MNLDSFINKCINAVSDCVKAASNGADTAQAPAQQDAQPSFALAEDTLRQFLNDYNCKYSVDKVDEENPRSAHRYYFDFQGGHFVVFAYHGAGIEVMYPRIVDVPERYLHIVRATCNQRNMQDSRFKYSYEHLSQDAEVGVHISYFAEVTTVEALHEALEACFGAQRVFNERLKNAIENARDEGTLDVERHFNDHKRERFLISNQEISHSQEPDKSYIMPEGKFALHHALREVMQRPDITLTRMQVIEGEKVSEVTAEDADLTAIDLGAKIFDTPAGGEPGFLCPTLVAVAHYKTPLSPNPDEEYALIVTMRAAGTSEHTAFCRVTMVFDQADVSLRNSILSKADNKMPTSYSFLIGSDTTSTQQMRAEAEYMWKDALIKLEEGNANDLTEEQQLLLDVTNGDTAYNMYWGRRYMLANRYYDAIAHFENAYRCMRRGFFSSNKEESKQFLQMMFFLGFCYCELRLWEKAFFYLNIVRTTGNIHHVMEYVNVLANSGDIRVFREIENIVDDIRQQYNDDDDIPEHVQSLLSFLRRRRAYSLIEFGEIEEAEKAFKALLDDPESHDYALSELAYIQKLKAQNEEEDASPKEGEAPSEKE
ncbi:MAG: hypothetical protein Q4B68_05490 [Bacteroidales bacterium]|nr:hypothetical protein [Bacteroidales bacterium]